MATDLLFDFFGTLVHYTPGAFHTAPYQRTHDYLLHHGYAISYEAFVSAFTAASEELETSAKQTCQEYHMDEVGRRFFRSAFDAEVSDTLLKSFIATFIAEWSRGILYLDTIEVFLERLAVRYRLSILSNTHYPALIHDNLAAMGIAHLFAQVVTSVEVGMRKPHPAIFQQSLALLRIAPSDALYIGDTYVDDYQGATAAQIRCVLIDREQRHPHVSDRLTTLFELERFLDTTV